WSSWGSVVTLVGGLVTASAGLVGLLGSLGIFTPNRPPEIMSVGPPSLRARRHEGVSFAVDAKDADGDVLTYQFRANVGTVQAVGNQVHWEAPPGDASRSVGLTVAVSDG